MRYNLIKTENYLLVVDDLNGVAKDGQTFLTKEGIIHTNVGWNYGDRVIIVHHPLNNALYLDNVPVLPSLADDDVDHLLIEEHEQAIKRGGVNYGTGYYEGLADGYNKAREKYKDDLWKMLMDFDLEIKNQLYKYPEIDHGLHARMCDDINDVRVRFFKSLQQPKLPIAFEGEMVEYGHYEMGVEDFIKHGENPKTITNSEGRTEWLGKYIYE